MPPVANYYERIYEEKTGTELSGSERRWISNLITKVKRGEGIHPGGVMILPEGMEWEDVTPLRPNDNENCPVATHMDCHAINPAVIKLDILCVTWYDQLWKMCAITKARRSEINYRDPAVYELFQKGDTCGIPEFSNKFCKELLSKLEKVSFSDLVKISGMAHGTDVWRDNGEQLLGEHPFRELIGDRDDVFLTLRKYGASREDAYALMTATRKGLLPWEGKHANDTRIVKENMELLEASNVPRWFAESMRKIYYLFPKAHAAHYTKMAVAFAWFKLYYPEVFYKIVLRNPDVEQYAIYSNEALEALLPDLKGQKWEAAQLVLEARQRGYAAEMN